jgi:hypothetical protein
MLTDTQKKLIELDKRKEEIKKYHEDLKETLTLLEKEQGINTYFSDEEGIVYKIVEPDGRFVYFEKLGYIRTKRPNEERGTLSVKEAKEHGFAIK